jgi:chorismate mutase
MTLTELQELRDTIDQLDEDIVALIAKRFAVTHQVGVLKAQNGFEAVDPSREKAQMARYDQLAAQHGLNANFIRQIFRSLIDEVVLKHKALAAETGGS